MPCAFKINFINFNPMNIKNILDVLNYLLYCQQFFVDLHFYLKNLYLIDKFKYIFLI